MASGSTIGAATLKRLQKELKDCEERPVDGTSVVLKNDDMLHWEATISGPDGTPYKDGLFYIDITFPGDFPFKPPKVKFNTRVYHCNVDEKGDFCHPSGMLKEKWSPATSVKKILEMLIDMLKNPNIEDPLRAEIATQLKENKAEHDKTAAEWTKKYAE